MLQYKTDFFINFTVQGKEGASVELREGEYVDTIFTQLTSNWLKREIVILPWNENDDPLDPFRTFTIRPVDSEGRPVNAEGTYYMLYYPVSWFAEGSHYQSIIPIGYSDLPNQPR